MDLCNEKDIRALLGRHGFRFSKSMGQNFLIGYPGTSRRPPAQARIPACWRSALASAL